MLHFDYEFISNGDDWDLELVKLVTLDDMVDFMSEEFSSQRKKLEEEAKQEL